MAHDLTATKSDVSNNGGADKGTLERRPTAVPFWLLALIAVAMATFALSARSGPVVAAVLMATLIAGTWGRIGRFTLSPRETPAAFLAAGLAGWAALSLVWTPDPASAIEKVLTTGLIVGLAIYAARAVGTLRVEELRPIATALAVGFTFGALFIGVELWTDQAIKIWVYNTIPEVRPSSPKGLGFDGTGTVVSVAKSERNRSVAVLILLYWPVLAGALWAITGSLRNRGALVVGALATAVMVAIVFSSNHESSKVGVVLSAGAVLVALISAPMVRMALAIVWVVGTLSVLPVTAQMYEHGLHFEERLPATARARVILWGETAKRWGEAPLFGHGVHATRAYQNAEKGTYEQPAGFVYPKAIGRHAHNAYLQTWFELGSVGALLLAALGAALAFASRALSSASQPFVLAAFTSVAVMAAFSYGIWQAWYQCLIMLALLGACLAARIGRTSSP